MPIRINLLAEARALEDERRRDPVKRVIWVGVMLVVLVLAWSGSLQVKIMLGKSQLGGLQANLNSLTNDYRQILESQKQLSDNRAKLGALYELSTNRFLNGNLLNALESARVEHVQLLRLKVQQAYVATEATKPKTDGGRKIPGKPATDTEKITVTLEARDTSPNPGDAVNKFRQVIAGLPYFRQELGSGGEVRLANLGALQKDSSGNQFVLFSIECRFPEKIR